MAIKLNIRVFILFLLSNRWLSGYRSTEWFSFIPTDAGHEDWLHGFPQSNRRLDDFASGSKPAWFA
jgi:hypothetical protein